VETLYTNSQKEGIVLERHEQRITVRERGIREIVTAILAALAASAASLLLGGTV
jgi:predicted RNA-binding Zn ribbon-like protein